MIPDFKTYIGESTIWGDLARRSGGDRMRSEDSNKCTEFAVTYTPKVIQSIKDAGLEEMLDDTVGHHMIKCTESTFVTDQIEIYNNTEIEENSKIADVFIQNDRFNINDEYICTSYDLFIGYIPVVKTGDVCLWLDMQYIEKYQENEEEPDYQEDTLLYDIEHDVWDWYYDLPAPDTNCDESLKKLLVAITKAVNPKTKYTKEWFKL